MAFAQGSRTGLAYVVESSFGSTPSNPALIDLPYNSHSLNLSKERVQGNEMRSDRIPRVDRHGNRSVSGDIVADLRADDFDDLIESAMFSTFSSAGVVTVGTSPQYMTVEDRALDITQYRQFTGIAVSNMSISIAPNQMIQTTFSCVGKDMTQAQTSLDSSPTSASSNQPFDSYSGTIKDGGSEVAIVTSIDFSIANSLAPTFVVGSAAAPQLEYGRAVVEGTLTAYYEDNSLIDKFLDETASNIEVSVADPGSVNTYTFLIPNAKYNGADVPVSDPQSRTVTLPFVGIYDSGEGTNLKITKS